MIYSCGWPDSEPHNRLFTTYTVTKSTPIMLTTSIVITTYNRPVFLAQAIHSCLAQTKLPDELVIGDDSPGDESRLVVEEIAMHSPVKIRYIHNQPSLKQARNVNMLLEAATGDRIMLLHDDDLLMPESLQTLSDVFTAHPNTSVAYGKQYIIDKDGVIDMPSSETFNRDFYRENQYEGAVLTPFEAGLSQQFPNNGYLIDATVARHIKWRYDVGNGCEYDFSYRIGLAGYELRFIDKYVGKYRLLPDSMSHSKTADQALQAFIIMRDGPVPSAMAASIRERRLTERAPIAITEAVNVGRRQEAIAILFSPWYRGRILTPRGIKRVLYILLYGRMTRLNRPAPVPQTSHSTIVTATI